MTCSRRCSSFCSVIGSDGFRIPSLNTQPTRYVAITLPGLENNFYLVLAYHSLSTGRDDCYISGNGLT